MQQNFGENVKVAHNEQLGKHFVAAIDLAPGDIILEEHPLFVTAHWDAMQMKCAACLRDSFVMCTKCEVYPLCLDCNEHDAYECGFFSGTAAHVSRNLLVKNYGIGAVLKLLLLMERETTRASCEPLLARHYDNARSVRDKDAWQERDQHVVQPLLDSGIAACFDHVPVDAALLHELCWRIDASAFDVTSKEGNETLKGVFVRGAQLPHHCLPNTTITMDNDFNLQIYAALAIPRGAIIYNCYANPMMGTSQRQHQLFITRQIECGCERCCDPSELGTHMSSLKCKDCTDGYAMCDVNSGGNWLCHKCQAMMEATGVHQLLIEVGEQMAAVASEDELPAYERLLAKYAAHFHANHFLLVDIKQNISGILSAMLLNPLCIPVRQVLQRKLQICEEILPVVRAVVPGVSKLYAIALYDYLLPFLELAEADFQLEEIGQQDYCRKMEIAHEMATETAEMLAFEPRNSPEGQLTRRIALVLKRIEENLSKFTAT